MRAQNDHFSKIVLQSSLLIQPWRQDELFPGFAGRDTALVCVCRDVCVLCGILGRGENRDKRLHLSESVVLATY